jgi:hypothetical protein
VPQLSFSTSWASADLFCSTSQIALHPGTVRTELSADFTGGPGGKPGRAKPKGEFEADEAAANLLRVVRGLTRDDSGGFRDWAGETVPY